MDVLQTLLDFAEEHNLCLDAEAARRYLENRVALEKNPNDPEARRIARHFEGVFFIPKSFGDFGDAPRCPNDCPECAAFNARANARSRAYFRQRGLTPTAKAA